MSSNGGASRRSGARWSVVLGLLSLAALPAAVTATRWSNGYDLLDSAAAIPVAIVLGILAIVLARRARNRSRLTLAGVRGARTARLGRLLGLTGLLVGITGAMAVGVFLVLSAVD
jgi:hypothetical protein